MTVLRFKASAASAASKLSKLRGIMNSASGLVQDVAAKFDGNISSVNGLRSTHALALLITQVQSMAHLDIFLSDERLSIKRVKKEDMKEHLEPAAPIYRYNGPKKPMVLVQHLTKYVLPLTILASQQVTAVRARDVDFTFFQMIAVHPEYSRIWWFQYPSIT
jgi:hypothetical protein